MNVVTVLAALLRTLFPIAELLWANLDRVDSLSSLSIWEFAEPWISALVVESDEATSRELTS